MDIRSAAKRILLRSNSRLLGRVASQAFLALGNSRFGISGLARLVFDACQPADPLRGEKDLPPVGIIVPFVLKDLDMLTHAVIGALRSCRNPVHRVTLVTPERTFLQVPEISQEIRKTLLTREELKGVEVEVLTDEGLLPRRALARVQTLNLEPRDYGWVVQQLVKISAVLASQCNASLVVDSDTVLMFPRTWIARDGRQILMIGQESREPFFSFANGFLGLLRRPRLSFVTHHQLMQKELWEELLGSPEGLTRIIDFALHHSSQSNPLKSISEYEIYGAYLAEKHPGLYRFATWGNGSGRRGNLEKGLEGDGKWALSVSYHHYLSRSGTPDSLL